MNTNTLEKLRKLKFHGMFHAFKSSLESGKTDDYTADELLRIWLMLNGMTDITDVWNGRSAMPGSAIRQWLKISITMPTEVLNVTRSCACPNVLSLPVMKTC